MRKLKTGLILPTLIIFFVLPSASSGETPSSDGGLPDSVFLGDIDYYLDPDDLTGKLEMPVMFVNSTYIGGLCVPLLWIGAATVDSISYAGGRLDEPYIVTGDSIDNGVHRLYLGGAVAGGPSIQEGRGLLATIFFDLSDSGWIDIDTAIFCTCALAFVDEYGGWTPEFVKGLFHLIPSPSGDANHDGSVGLPDIVFIINYLFRNGPLPACSNCTDVDCDCEISLVDVVYLINYLFRSGDPPQVGCVLPL